MFPLNIDVSLSRAVVHSRKEINEKISHSEKLGLFYKVDNGKEYHDSIVVKDLNEPVWSDVFSITLMSETEILFFQLMLSDKNTDTVRVLDSFDLRGSEVSISFEGSKIYNDTVVTSCGNEYSLSLKKKGDKTSKLKALQKKIDAQTATLSRLTQLYGMAKDKMEHLVNKKGMDLIKEWGLMTKKPKEAKLTKTSGTSKKLEEAKTAKRCTTPKITVSKSVAKLADVSIVGKQRSDEGLDNAKLIPKSATLKGPLKKNKSAGNEESKVCFYICLITHRHLVKRSFQSLHKLVEESC
jgi:hypothetical protein